MNNIAKYRAISGLTQTQLSARCGLARTYISFLEQGDPRKKITREAATKIAKVLNCTIPQLLGEDLFHLLPENDKERTDAILVLVKSIEDVELKEKILSVLK